MDLFLNRCAAIFAIALPARQNPPGSQPGNVDIAGLPTGRGIYYHAAPGWVAPQSTLLMPFPGGIRTMEFLNLRSSRNGVAENSWSSCCRSDRQCAAGVVTVKPRADPKPGEYAFASVLEPGDGWIQLGYDFGLGAGGARR